MDIWEN